MFVCISDCAIYLHSTCTSYSFFAVTKHLTAARSSLGRIYFGSQIKIERQAQTDRQIVEGYHNKGRHHTRTWRQLVTLCWQLGSRKRLCYSTSYLSPFKIRNCLHSVWVLPSSWPQLSPWHTEKGHFSLRDCVSVIDRGESCLLWALSSLDPGGGSGLYKKASWTLVAGNKPVSRVLPWLPTVLNCNL